MISGHISRNQLEYGLHVYIDQTYYIKSLWSAIRKLISIFIYKIVYRTKLGLVKDNVIQYIGRGTGKL